MKDKYLTPETTFLYAFPKDILASSEWDDSDELPDDTDEYKVG